MTPHSVVVDSPLGGSCPQKTLPLTFTTFQWYLKKNSKSCGIIYRIRNTLDIKSKSLIYYSLIRLYLTYCVNVLSSTYRTNLKMLCTAQKRYPCVHSLLPQQPHSRNIFLNPKILPLDKLINQQEGILAYKVSNGTYLLGAILTDRHELDHYQLRNYENLRIPLHSRHSQLFIRYSYQNLE